MVEVQRWPDVVAVAAVVVASVVDEGQVIFQALVAWAASSEEALPCAYLPGPQPQSEAKLLKYDRRKGVLDWLVKLHGRAVSAESSARLLMVVC